MSRGEGPAFLRPCPNVVIPLALSLEGNAERLFAPRIVSRGEGPAFLRPCPNVVIPNAVRNLSPSVPIVAPPSTFRQPPSSPPPPHLRHPACPELGRREYIRPGCAKDLTVRSKQHTNRLGALSSVNDPAQHAPTTSYERTLCEKTRKCAAGALSPALRGHGSATRPLMPKSGAPTAAPFANTPISSRLPAAGRKQPETKTKSPALARGENGTPAKLPRPRRLRSPIRAFNVVIPLALSLEGNGARRLRPGSCRGVRDLLFSALP